jgi:hypothetical protein
MEKEKKVEKEGGTEAEGGEEETRELTVEELEKIKRVKEEAEIKKKQDEMERKKDVTKFFSSCLSPSSTPLSPPSPLLPTFTSLASTMERPLPEVEMQLCCEDMARVITRYVKSEVELDPQSHSVLESCYKEAVWIEMGKVVEWMMEKRRGRDRRVVGGRRGSKRRRWM